MTSFHFLDSLQSLSCLLQAVQCVPHHSCQGICAGYSTINSGAVQLGTAAAMSPAVSVCCFLLLTFGIDTPAELPLQQPDNAAAGDCLEGYTPLLGSEEIPD